MLLNLATAARALGLDVDVVGPRSSGVVRAAEEAGFVVHGLGGTRREYLLTLRRWRARGEVLWANGLGPAFATAGQSGRVVHLHQQPRAKHTAAAKAARLGARVTLVPSRALSRDVSGARVLENWTADVTPSAVHATRTTPVVGFLGRPSVDKGVVVLAGAIHLLSQRLVDPPRLLLAGEPRFVAVEERRRVESALGRVQQLVDLVGWIAPEDFFAQVDVAAFPSVWQEPFGLVVAEAIEAALASPADETDRVVTAGRARWETHYSPVAGQTRLAALLRDLKLL
jgi:glycosyltransferase involved in cell wall biosynthesis